jgi:hypothetical protein
MAYFQPTWTQTAPDHSFGANTGLITSTETSDSFSGPLAIKPKVIPYPPSGNVVSFIYNQTYSTANINWNPVPIPTSYEVNPVNYSWSLYSSTSSVLIDSGTRSTTSVSSVFGTSEYYFMVYKFYTINYVNDYLYITTNSTGGGGTSSNSQSIAVQHTPSLMSTPSITAFSTLINASALNINLNFSMAAPPNPTGIVSTLFTIGLYSNITAEGTYTTCSTIGFYTQFQGAQSVGGGDDYSIQLCNSQGGGNIDFYINTGYYYTAAMVASDMRGNISDSTISEPSNYSFYDPVTQTVTGVTFTITAVNTLANVRIAPQNTMQSPPITDQDVIYYWVLYTNTTDSPNTYVSTVNNGTLTYAETNFAPGATITLTSSISGDNYNKLYIESRAPNNIARPSPFFSTASGVYALPSVTPAIINTFTMNDTTHLSVTFNITPINANQNLLPNIGWGYGLYFSATETGTYVTANRSGVFNLSGFEPDGEANIPTYAPIVTSGTKPNFIFTLTSYSFAPVSSGVWYKVAIQGVATTNNVTFSGHLFPGLLTGPLVFSSPFFLA